MVIQASFDDGTIEDMKVADLVSKYDIDTIFYWPYYPERCNEINGRTSLSLDQMKQIALNFEIGSHTMTHPLLTRIKPIIARTEIETSRKALSDRFDQNIQSFSYPRGYANPEIEQMVIEAGYNNARSTLVGYIHESENPYFTQTTVHVGFNRKEYGGLDWLDYAMKLLKMAQATKNSVYHLFGHSWELQKYNQWDKFETLLGAL